MQTRKELKEAYKQRKPKMGVFQIRNTQNGKIFIDSSMNLDASWNSMRTQLNFGSHPNVGLVRDWKTFGEEKFVFEILSEVKAEDNVLVDYTREVKTLKSLYLEELQPFDDKGYNPRPRY